MAVPQVGAKNYAVGVGSSGAEGKTLALIQATGRDVTQFIDYVELSKGLTPLTYLLMKLGQTKKVRNSSFIHLEYDANPMSVQVNGPLDAEVTSTTLVLDTPQGNYIKAYDILYNPLTEEQMYVSAVASPTSCTITRGHGSSDPAAIADNSVLLIMSPTIPGGGRSQYALYTEPTLVRNYVQIARESVSLERRAMEAEAYGPDDWPRAKKAAADRLSYKMELSVLLNALNATTPVTTGGIDHWVSSNVVNAGGVLTEQTFNNWLRDIFSYNQDNPSKVLLIFGDFILGYLDAWGRDRLTQSPNDTATGIAIAEYKSSLVPGGKVKFIRHGMLSKAMDPNTANPMAGLAFAVNMDHLKLAFYGNSGQVNFRDNIQENDEDCRKGEWFADWGVYMSAERRFGKLYGVTELT